PLAHEMVDVETRYANHHGDTREIMPSDGPVWVDLHGCVPVLLREVNKIAEVQRTALEAGKEFMDIQRVAAGACLEASDVVSALAGQGMADEEIAARSSSQIIISAAAVNCVVATIA